MDIRHGVCDGRGRPVVLEHVAGKLGAVRLARDEAKQPIHMDKSRKMPIIVFEHAHT